MGGGPPKKPPKSKVFGSIFASLKILFFLFLVVFLFTQRTNEIEEGLKQPHNIHIIPGGFEFVATTACITVDSSSFLCESVSQHAEAQDVCFGSWFHKMT